MEIRYNPNMVVFNVFCHLFQVFLQNGADPRIYASDGQTPAQVLLNKILVLISSKSRESQSHHCSNTQSMEQWFVNEGTYKKKMYKNLVF